MSNMTLPTLVSNKTFKLVAVLEGDRLVKVTPLRLTSPDVPLPITLINPLAGISTLVIATVSNITVWEFFSEPTLTN